MRCANSNPGTAPATVSGEVHALSHCAHCAWEGRGDRLIHESGDRPSTSHDDKPRWAAGNGDVHLSNSIQGAIAGGRGWSSREPVRPARTRAVIGATSDPNGCCCRALACVVLSTLALSSTAAAAGVLELDEVVVTGSRPESVWQQPRSVAVITRADIERGTSGNLVDLLAREANVNLRSFFGNDKSAGVDIRGMGDTFVSNVLVLVDGVRINASDLSGADFASIPLDQIERVEIVRGANAVR